MINKLFFLLPFFLISIGLIGQDLLSPSFGFSKKKTAYITLVDGSEINGTIKDIDRKKGLIDFIKIKDGEGKNHKLKPEKVKFMYLPPSGLDKLSKAKDFLSDAKKWNDGKLNQDFLNQGYVYFELADVKIKKKNQKLLMQLLNPQFSKIVKVYHDPFAKETMSLGVGGVDVVGGIAKSYYISKEGQPAFKLKKKDYKTEFVPLWKSCPKIVEEFTNQKWDDLVKHIITYSECNE